MIKMDMFSTKVEVTLEMLLVALCFRTYSAVVCGHAAAVYDCCNIFLLIFVQTLYNFDEKISLLLVKIIKMVEIVVTSSLSAECNCCM